MLCVSLKQNPHDILDDSGPPAALILYPSSLHSPDRYLGRQKKTVFCYLYFKEKELKQWFIQQGTLAKVWDTFGCPNGVWVVHLVGGDSQPHKAQDTPHQRASQPQM